MSSFNEDASEAIQHIDEAISILSKWKENPDVANIITWLSTQKHELDYVEVDE